MKKLNSLYIARFLQIAAIAYLVFVLLSDIMKWQQLDRYSSDPCHLSYCNDN